MKSVRNMFATEVKTLLGSSVPEDSLGIETALQELGLSQAEVSLYRSTLQLGPRPASILAKSIQVQRTRVYDLLSSLQSRGLIDSVERNSVRYYSATSPENLLNLVRERKKHMMTHLEQLETAIPTLFRRPHPNITKIEGKTLRGTRVVQEALDSLLHRSEPALLSVGDIEEAMLARSDMNSWAEQFRMNRIRQGILMQTSKHGPAELVTDKAFHREILLSPEIPAGTLLLGTNNTLVLLEETETIQATKIESRAVCFIVKSFYNSWRHAVTKDLGKGER